VTQGTSTPTREAIFIDFIEEFGELVPALRVVAGEGLEPPTPDSVALACLKPAPLGLVDLHAPTWLC
jgi:hypothetical protein